MVWTLTQIALGGAVGALARFGTQSLAFRLFGPGFPVGTVAVNVLGSLVMGVFAALLVHKGLARFSPLVMVGFLGAYTTFSTYALDALELWESGQGGLAGLYVIGSVLLSVAACALGLALGRGLVA